MADLVEDPNVTEEKMDTIVGWLGREVLMRRLAAGDLEGLRQPLERLRKNFYQLWKPLYELYLGEYANPILLEHWRRAQEGSQEWRKARFHDEAIEVLLVATKR
jgi:hypothetical protein